MGLKQILVIGAVAALACATAVGCESNTKQAESTSSAAAADAESDEDQIRDLIDKQTAAYQAFDVDEIVDLTCTKYQDDIRDEAESSIPPISQFGTEAELTATPAAEIASGLAIEFPSASSANIDDLADALVRYDESDYEEAMLALFSDVIELKVDDVENIEITGDTATADITSTTTFGDEEPETKTESNEFVKEDGKWKDCEPPDS